MKVSVLLSPGDLHVSSVEIQRIQSLLLPSSPQQPGGRLPAEEDHPQGEDGGGDEGGGGQSPGEGGAAEHADEEAGGVADHGEDTAGAPEVGVGDLADEDGAGHEVTARTVTGQQSTWRVGEVDLNTVQLRSVT